MEDIKELKHHIENLKVLFVDDEEEIRKSTSIFLEKFFNDIEICVDGENALNTFKKTYNDTNKKNFNIVITDIKMPKLNGIDMVNEIKKIDNNVYIVFITASREDEDDLIKNNVYIKKPLSYDDIIYIMENIKLHFDK